MGANVFDSGVCMPIANKLTRPRLWVMAVWILAWLACSAQAQTWPVRPLSLIVPYTSGGSSDIGARMLATDLGKSLGQPLVVDNVAGAGGAIGMQKLLRAAPDGYTLIYGGMSESMLVPMINKTVHYRPEDPLPVAVVGSVPVVLVTRADFPARNVDELIDLLRKKPGQYSYGSAGIGSFAHVMTEAIKDRTGAYVVHIPYRGSAQIVADLVGGQIDLAVTTVTSVAPMLASGRLKILGVSSRERVPLIKDVQTFAETNSLRGLEMMVWAVLFAPPGTPDAVVQKLNAAANQTLAQPAMKAMVAKLGAEVPPVWSPAQTKEFLAAQRKLYAQAIGRIQPE
jgi:tripartite-type tricarboxylate transporter receptor subunit TctC